MNSRLSMLAGSFGAALAAAAALGWALPFAAPPGGEAATIGLGRQLYAQHCASCHGDRLQGQPDWKSPLPSGRMPAPPHDASGHTWHHPDGVLFRILVSDAEDQHEVFRRVVAPFTTPADRGWQDVEVDLAQYGDRTIEVTLNTNASLPPQDDRRGDLALWGAPRIVAPQS